MTKNCTGIMGYIDPKWLRPDDDGSACIIIYGIFVSPIPPPHLVLLHSSDWDIPRDNRLRLPHPGMEENMYSVAYFVAQYFCTVVAPVFFSTAIYTILSVMINAVGLQFAPLQPKVILWIFIACDAVATIIQITGASLVGSAYSNRKDPNKPNHILLAGLTFQVFSFALFILLFGVFRYMAWSSLSRQLRLFTIATFVATGAVYLRTVIRLAETAEGLLKFLSTHEAIFGALEFLPVIVAVYIFIYWHPDRWLGAKVGVVQGERGAPNEHELLVK